MYEKLKVDLETNGFLAIDCVLTKEELRPYAKLYDDIMEGCVNTERHRIESYRLDMPDKRALSFWFPKGRCYTGQWVYVVC